jgi:hypothetical protein
MYTLCEKCNNRTGAWYGRSLVVFTEQAASYLTLSKGAPTLTYPYHIRPLRVLKQIVTMFFSVNADDYHENQPALAGFVLQPHAGLFPPGYRVFTYFSTSPIGRYVGWALKLDHGIPVCNLTEITARPLSYVMTWKTDPPHPEMCEITHFAKYGLDEPHMEFLKLPVLPVWSAYPGDYRTKEEVETSTERTQDAAIPGYPDPLTLVKI